MKSTNAINVKIYFQQWGYLTGEVVNAENLRQWVQKYYRIVLAQKIKLKQIYSVSLISKIINVYSYL